MPVSFFDVCMLVHTMERIGTLNNIADHLFRFPNTQEAGLGFVFSIVNLARVPVIVVDRRMYIHTANLQAEELLLRFESSSEDGSERKLGKDFPVTLRRHARSCLKTGHAKAIAEFRFQEDLKTCYDVLLCPGAVKGQDMCFIIVFPPGLEGERTPDSMIDRVLESLDAVAIVLDQDLRFQVYNSRYLDTYDLSDEEVRDRRMSARSSPEQMKAFEKQIQLHMARGEVWQGNVRHWTSTRKGVVFVAPKAWPFYDRQGTCRGTGAVWRPVPAPLSSKILDETKERLFGKLTAMLGPPMFLTHLDGMVVFMNNTARALVGDTGERGQLNLKSAVAWAHPEIIEKLYADIVAGSDYTAVMTAVNAPGGSRTFQITAYGLKEIGDITSEVLVHAQDVTEPEHSRNLLAETAKKLATEKDILDKVIGGLRDVRIAYAVVDKDLTILRVSETVLEVFSKDASFFVGKKVYELDPSTRDSGIVTNIKTVIDRGQGIEVKRFPYALPGGRKTLLTLGFHPIRSEGKLVCLVTAENMTERLRLEEDLGRSRRRLGALLGSTEDGIALIDRNGIVLDVNASACRVMGVKREDIVGKPDEDAMSLEERDMLLEFKRRALMSRQPVRTGVVKLKGMTREPPIFVDITCIPLLDDDGAIEEAVVLISFLTDVVNLEQQVKEYTENLERLVSERTDELSSANSVLEATVDRLASMARSGMVLSSLKDTDSVMASFLKETREVLAADFASVAIVTSTDGNSKTTYYSGGETPPQGVIPSEIVERNLAQLALGGLSEGDLHSPRGDLLIMDFAFSRHRGLLLAWKRDREFTSIDRNLSRLLCTQLGFSLPITSYVNDLRLERDRSQCLRRIAFRTAGSKSVGSAIRIVAEELSKVTRADRFFWVVSKNEKELWLSEVYRQTGIPTRALKRLSAGQSRCLSPLLKACHDTHRQFCERFPHFGGEDFSGEHTSESRAPCPFVREAQGGDLAGCLRELLRSAGLLSRDEGSIIVAPVTLSSESWGMLCAFNEARIPFPNEDCCFMCLAASTVGHMWHAADASSSIRRLEAEGETVSELAHDLKYPLMRIRDAIANIACCNHDVLEQDPALGDIGREVDRLNLLVQELIDVSNHKTRKPEIIDVSEIVDYCISIASGDAAERPIQITKHVDCESPPIFANKKDVKTILLNILSNCIDAAGDEGRVDITITTDGSRMSCDCVSIIVADSGPGVGADEIDRVFDPFYSTKDDGSGIGLFSAKKRAQVNGGDVVCEIGEDGRSRFVIWFALAAG